ncbi:MAG TPA: haloacid dehalogenase type II [Azospira sp.]|nr:haloacid dehalogenase type II [Azospira sp.]
MTASCPLKAIVFDAYGTLFDVYSVGALAEQLFPGKGVALAALWRDKQIEYSRIRSMSGRYKPFWDVTQDALVYAAAALGIPLGDEERGRLMSQYACLSAFPENLPALKELKALGLPLAILSNGTRAMLDIAVKSSGMGGLFEHILSAETVQKFKTAPEVYQLGPDAFGLPAREILFVSANSWDACGATWFGYTSFWINRTGQPAERLDVAPTANGHRLSDVVAFIKGRA